MRRTVTRITMGLMTLLCCNVAVGQRSTVLPPKWELAFFFQDAYALRDTAANADKTAWAGVDKVIGIYKQVSELIINSDKCEVSDSYDTIFTPQAWSDAATDYVNATSSSGTFSSGYHWTFEGSDTLRFYQWSYRRYGEGDENNSAVQTAVYRFDKANKLLYVKWGNNKQSRELVLRPYLYSCARSEDGHQEVLVLFIYRQATWAMPAEEVVTHKAAYYNTFIRTIIHKK